MNSLHKLLILGALLLCAGPGFTQQAVIRELAGTVEIKRPGAAQWETARKGLVLESSAMISTGFRSTALVALGNSLLTVRPLTRLTLVEIARMKNEEKVELRLQTGRVRAEVPRAEAGKTDFTVRSSAATASVRGTVFEFDAYNLRVIEGTVAFSGASGGPVLVDPGRTSYTDEQSLRPPPPEETALEELRPPLPPGAAEALPGEGSAAGNGHQDLTVTVGF
ncbi:MAG: FecR family protein [Treponema sp.]|jgi:hypothetical protein|nr:FecR family protein [Treponema sp.]